MNTRPDQGLWGRRVAGLRCRAKLLRFLRL